MLDTTNVRFIQIHRTSLPSIVPWVLIISQRSQWDIPMWYRFIRLICPLFFRTRYLTTAIYLLTTYPSSWSPLDMKTQMALTRPSLTIQAFAASSGSTSRSFTGFSNGWKTLVQQYPLKSLFSPRWMRLSSGTNVSSMGVFLMKPRSRRSVTGLSAKTLPRSADSLVSAVCYAFLSVISLLSLAPWFI